jgi:hypothetical protein
LTEPVARLVVRLAARALPASDRELIVADLREESAALRPSRRAGWITRQALGIAARFQAECYRNPDDRLRIAALAVAGLALLWIVPLATSQNAGSGIEALYDPVSRAILELWRAAHLTSAAAAGLVVGRLTMLPAHTQPARWHVGVLLAISCIASHGPRAGSAAAALLLATLWLGSQGRRAVEVGR